MSGYASHSSSSGPWPAGRSCGVVAGEPGATSTPRKAYRELWSCVARSDGRSREVVPQLAAARRPVRSDSPLHRWSDGGSDEENVFVLRDFAEATLRCVEQPRAQGVVL